MFHQNKYITNLKFKGVNLQITIEVELVKVPAIKTSASHHHKITIRNDLSKSKARIQNPETA